MLDDAESTRSGDVTTEQAFAALSLVLEPDPITGRLRGDLDTLSFEHKSSIRELLGKVLHAEGVESTNGVDETGSPFAQIVSRTS